MRSQLGSGDTPPLFGISKTGINTMEEKYNALVLRAIDYKDNDKLLTLFAAGKGKMTAALKGVKKASAKLKFAAQPFCFAEFVFAERSGRYTVTSAYLHDGFYSLREDIGKFYAASAVLEICDKLLPEEMPGDELFVRAVHTLGEICQKNEGFALLTFLLSALALAGYKIDTGNCPDCGNPVLHTPYFDFDRGAFCCADCPTDTRVSEITYRTICNAEQNKEQPLGLKIDSDGVKRALRLLKEYFIRKTDQIPDCLGEYIRLI
jgi:DNA repair protein RecO (recombination protein O)